MNSKIYRCGYCGQPTDVIGYPLRDEAFKKCTNIIDTYGDSHTIQVHGYCCVHENEREEPRRITRDMAIDAGDPNLEGNLY